MQNVACARFRNLDRVLFPEMRRKRFDNCLAEMGSSGSDKNGRDSFRVARQKKGQKGTQEIPRFVAKLTFQTKLAI